MRETEEIATTFGGEIFRALRVVERVAAGLMQYVELDGEREHDAHVYQPSETAAMGEAGHACLLRLVALVLARRA